MDRKSSSAIGYAHGKISRNDLREIVMEKPSFVYVTYIESTPERVWCALVDSEMTRL